MIAVLTPTGARPEAFAACVEQMRAQDEPGPVTWYIVDDGPDATPSPDRMPANWRICMARVEPKYRWQPGQNTQARNMARLLSLSGEIASVIVEDDDSYAPDWISTCRQWLADADLVGESHSLYVDRRTGRRREMRNALHASLCSTAVAGPAKAALHQLCGSEASGLDIKLWRGFRGRKRLYLPEPRRVTGVKGWPGRPGIGVGHRM